ncbi:unnamed protein product [Vitrella brassicaformis CCMP3155]|uniref:EF-hand domain-containing protein n=2 Tax=Vitrella brassicaformis TaxID=1169539 RepID=A0A0G4FI87_VITBC|nr:unnamed protein product [Vitrella brassicaformis CCMP3155]|eukprot:CEM13048.1 unnamed protein product [Vitrella brassicaformis CCMP3155]
MEKKLVFSKNELMRLAAPETHFTLEEVQVIYREFRRQAGHRKPMIGGLNPVQFLNLFDLANAVSYTFAERFIYLFWRHRTQGVIDIGFEEFIRVFSVWTRGSPSERLGLVFRLYDKHEKGYLLKQDIIDFLQSLFEGYQQSNILTYEKTSPEFKAQVELQAYDRETLARESHLLFDRIATDAIRAFHTRDDAELLWVDEFHAWLVNQPGILHFLCIPNDVNHWLDGGERPKPKPVPQMGVYYGFTRLPSLRKPPPANMSQNGGGKRPAPIADGSSGTPSRTHSEI